MKSTNYKFALLFILVSFYSIKNMAQNELNYNYSVLHQPPNVDFSWEKACFGDTTNFINGSIRASTYVWTVYNKNMSSLYTSNSLNISYFFPTKDTFYVELVADNGHNTSSLQMVVIDTVSSANFTFMHCSNQFMNHSTCATSFFWDFGDGTTSAAVLPTHQYADTGHYNVKLIAFKGLYSDTIIKQIFVNPIAFPTGAITWHLSYDTIFVHAVDSSAGMFYNWNFGGGVHLYKRDTFYVYPNTGTYYLNFSDWNTCNTAYAMDTVYFFTTGSKSIENINYSTVNFFPNPIKSGETLNILFNSFKQKIHFSMFNIIGEEIKSGDIFYSGTNFTGTLIMSGISKGIYFFKIIEGENIFTKKVIVD